MKKQWPRAGRDQCETSLVERRASAARPQRGKAWGRRQGTPRPHTPRVDDLRGISTQAPFYKACLALVSARLRSLLLHVLVQARFLGRLETGQSLGAVCACMCVCVCVCVGRRGV